MNNDNQNLEGKLVESIEAKELGSLTADYAELGLDAILDDGIAKNIPIVGTLIKAAKIGINVRDRLYAKKIIGFLVQIAKTTQEQRDKFVGKHYKDGKRFEETIMLILEKADRIEKTTLIGKVFKACILGKIIYEDAIRLSEMVNRCFWSDMQAMFYLNDSKEHHQRLFISGLFEMKGQQQRSIKDDTFVFQRSIYAFTLPAINSEDYEKLDNCKLRASVKSK